MPKTYQILLSEQEKTRIMNRIEYDWMDAKTAHEARSRRFAEYLKRWEGRVSAPRAGEEDKPNHPVPLIRWNCFQKVARDIQSMFDVDARITAVPTGPSDYEAASKVGQYMTSRVFSQMKLIVPACEFQFRRILNGRSIAYRPWYRRRFNTLQDGRLTRVCDYEGPGFFPLRPDDIVVPGERGVDDIQGFSFAIRRYPATIDELQYGDGDLYQGTSDRDFVERAIQAAKRGSSRSDAGSNPVRDEEERSKGVQVDDSNWRSRRTLWVWEWYGSWRPLKKQKRDAEQDDLERRLPYEADWVVRYIPDMNEVVGCQDLLELYPRMRRRRPLVDSSLIKDGTYWSMGFGQMLLDIEDEATAVSQLFTAAGELSVWPLIFYRPGGGYNPKAQKIEPGTQYPVEDPASVNVVTFRPDLSYCQMKSQDSISNGERTSGITDYSMGRASDRPNAPRTATGQLALIEEGNVRAYLDATVMREDFGAIIRDIWDLDCDLAPKSDPGIWFRVTESVPTGAGGFDTVKGGAYMTAKEFGGTYDFALKFAVSAYSRDAQAQRVVQFYQLAMLNPLVQQSPRALWALLDRVCKALGLQDFSGVIPQPPELDQPKTPQEEWTLMLEGQEVIPNPADHDALHLQDHMKQLVQEQKNPDPDRQAENLLIAHVRLTREQVAAKQAMQALTQDLIKSIQPAGGEGAPDVGQLMGAMQQGQQPQGFGSVAPAEQPQGTPTPGSQAWPIAPPEQNAPGVPGPEQLPNNPIGSEKAGDGNAGIM